jgi:hypothetical protein
MYFELNLSPSARRGHWKCLLKSSIKFLAIVAVSSCSCYWQQASPQTNSINHAVESSFQYLLDLSGAGGAVRGTIDKGSEELEPIIISKKLGC